MKRPTSGTTPNAVDPSNGSSAMDSGRPARFTALLVEDDAIIALDLESLLRAQGAAEVYVASSVDEAMRLLETTKTDVALVDAILNGEQSTPVAQRLAELGISYAMSTGLDAGDLDAAYGDRPALYKPFTSEELSDMLTVLLAENDRA